MVTEIIRFWQMANRESLSFILLEFQLIHGHGFATFGFALFVLYFKQHIAFLPVEIDHAIVTMAKGCSLAVFVFVGKPDIVGQAAACKIVKRVLASHLAARKLAMMNIPASKEYAVGFCLLNQLH